MSEGIDEIGQQVGYHGWKGLSRLMDWLTDHWDRPDEASGRPGAAARTSPTAG